MQLRPSTEFTHGELAALFTAAYEGYFVPFAVDEATLRYMVDVFDLDLGRSLVAVDDGAPVGLANLGRRGACTWLGGVGVVASRRGEGIGELLTSRLLEQAGAAGATEMALEVIVDNHPAISLYDKLGFVRTRELEVLSLAAEDAGRGRRRAGVPGRRQEPRPRTTRGGGAVATRRRHGRHGSSNATPHRRRWSPATLRPSIASPATTSASSRLRATGSGSPRSSDRYAPGER